MRLIDADKLKANTFKNDISYNAFVKLVDRQPTIVKEDAVPVVRCKDCYYYMDYENRCFNEKITADNIIEPNWFCADGERKEK